VHETSSCIGCGLCDVVARDIQTSRFIVAVARQPEDAPLALDAAARLRQVSEDVARICPARVAPTDIARLIEENARALTELERDDPA
jgi:hypothetical protein